MNVPRASSGDLCDAPPPYALVAFDCDSTLSELEGIDELVSAAPGPVRTAVERMTRRAMAGELALEQVYRERLERVRPTRAALAAVGARYVETVLPHAVELVAALQALEKRVVIVSGGLQDAVRVLGAHLGLPVADVHAVPLEFDEHGNYAAVDAQHPLARSGGKPELLSQLGAAAGGPVALVGDGATDLEAAGVVARFVAYGGVAHRPLIHAAARVRCDAPDLAALVPLLCSPTEVRELARTGEHAALLAAAPPYSETKP